MTAPDLTESSGPRAGSRFLELVSSAGGIYGLIVVSGVIVVTRNLTGSSWEALLAVVDTLLVFFAAHVYAATLAEMSHNRIAFAAALRAGIAESLGMLLIGLIPVLVLLGKAWRSVDHCRVRVVLSSLSKPSSTDRTAPDTERRDAPAHVPSELRRRSCSPHHAPDGMVDA